jgi:chromosomal replication initiator protein
MLILSEKGFLMAEWDYQVFWNETMNQLRADLGEEEFSVWFGNLKYLRAGETGLNIAVPSSFYRDQVKSRYQKLIEGRLKDLSGKDLGIDFEVITDSGPESASKQPNAPEEGVKNPPGSGESGHNSASSGAVGAPVPSKEKKSRPGFLSDDYTFEKYIIGENNNFAANAAIAISRNPGHAYNPFLIYGGAGLGKTHLMQAIGNYIYENSDNDVIYTTAEDFLNEFVQSIKAGKPNAFKNKFRYTDVLLIDDIQFFQDKIQIQEEFFHTFNTLLNAKKQIVVTCDRPISELKKFSDRLLSRFGQSLSVDLQPPRYEVRCAILKSTAENRGASIPNEVIDFISKNISSNIRDLIGALKTLISYAEIMGQPVTLEIAQQKLRDMIGSRWQANLSIDIIIRVVAEYFNLSPPDLKGKKRTQNIVGPRQIAMYITREITDYSTIEIGESFGGRDHATVIHSIEKIRGQLITDPSLEPTLETLKRMIKESSAK